MRNKRNNWKSSRPTEHLEPKDFEYYIFCEGQQTEPNYFNGFKELICILSRQGCCTEAGARPLGLKKLHSDTRNDIMALLPIIGSNAIFYGDNTYGNNESAFR